ncbi:MAG: MerR family transcriptional regulator [Isosphaeraceae bacterium]
MNDSSAILWTIHELTAQVKRELAVDYAGASSGRIRDVPDTRTIRYYTTLGLLDRPAQMRGRTALYGRRHLLQLVAIKKLQAAGLSLTQVQKRLAGATDRLLQRLAGVRAESRPDGKLERPDGRGTQPSGGRAEKSPRAFWKAHPPRGSASPEPREVPSQPPAAHPETPRQALEHEEVKPLQAIELGGHVMLLLAPARPIDRAELPALRQAAAPLIRHLRIHKLIHSPLKGGGDDPGASPVD